MERRSRLYFKGIIKIYVNWACLHNTLHACKSQYFWNVFLNSSPLQGISFQQNNFLPSGQTLLIIHSSLTDVNTILMFFHVKTWLSLIWLFFYIFWMHLWKVSGFIKVLKRFLCVKTRVCAIYKLCYCRLNLLPSDSLLFFRTKWQDMWWRLRVQRFPKKALVLPKGARPALISTRPSSDQFKLKESQNRFLFDFGRLLELMPAFVSGIRYDFRWNFICLTDLWTSRNTVCPSCIFDGGPITKHQKTGPTERQFSPTLHSK